MIVENSPRRGEPDKKNGPGPLKCVQEILHLERLNVVPLCRQYATVHAILGLVAVGLAIVQMIGGFARPAPGTKFRRVWTWLHRLEGVVAFLLSGESDLSSSAISLPLITLCGWNLTDIQDARGLGQTLKMHTNANVGLEYQEPLDQK